jgi:hypothetical protein
MIYRVMLVDAGQNRQAARRKLVIPVLARGGSLVVGDRSEAQMRLMAHDVTGHVFDAGVGHLPEEVPDEMADVILPFWPHPGRLMPAVKRGGVPRSPCNGVVAGE